MTVDSLDIQISAQSNSAIKSLDRLVGKLNTLPAALGKIDTSGLTRLSTNAKKLSSIDFSDFKNGLNNTSSAMNQMSKRSKDLALSVGKLYLAFKTVEKGAKALWTSVESSMNYVETLNYFDAAFDQVAQKADLSNFRQLGYDSAEEYAKSFSERAKQLTAQMTGFAVTDKGTLEATGMPSLGLNPSQLMQYQAMFGQMASSMGVASETSLKLSRALTEIGADLASVKNMDFDKVWTDMASGLAGMSRTLDKYGVNIRNVNLQQKLTELGINVNITALNQNDKALLRTIILLDSTKYAWGDLADTINQPANQLRLINANFQNLGRTIGNLFLPLVQKVLPYINALTIALQRLFTWVGSLLGIDLSKVTSSVGDTDFSNIIDGTDDLTDGLDNATKAAKKLKTVTLGIDELNINAPQEEQDSMGVGGAGGLGSGLLDAAFEDALSEYQKVWDEAFANMENRAQELADKIEKFFEPIKKIIQDFTVGDFFQAGQDVSDLVISITEFFTKAIKEVNWYKIGQNIGEFFAGIKWTKVFKSVGKLIWTALKASLDAWSGMFDVAPIETTIITAIGLLKFTKLGSVLSGTLVSKINVALGKISKGLNLQKIAIGISSVFGEFTLVSDAFEGLISKSQGIGSALGEIVIGAGLAAGALKLIGLSNPWTAVIVGITGVVGALKGMADAQQAAFEKFAEEQELAVFGEKVSDITQRINESATAVRDRIQASNEYVQTAGIAETQMVQDLADRYFDLSEKESLTNEESDEMRKLAGLLVEKMPELEQYYNGQTGLIDTTRKSIEELIEQRLKEIQLNAIEEQLTEAYKTRAEALKALGEATGPVQEAQEELTRLQGEYEEAVSRCNAAIALEEIGNLIAIGVENMDGLTVSQDLLNQLSSAGVEPAGNLRDIYKELWDIVTNQGTEDIPAISSLNSKVAETKAEIELLSEDYEGLLTEFSNSKSAYDEAEQNISNLSKMMSEGMQGVGTDFGTGYKEGILSQVEEVEAAGRELAESGIGSVRETNDSHSPSVVAMGLGKDFVDGYNLGILNNTDSSIQAINKWATSVLEAMKTALGIGGMSDTADPSTSMFGGMLTNFTTTWEAFSETWTTKLEEWKALNDELYFGEEIWNTNWMNLYDTYVTMWKQFSDLWKKNFDNWWEVQIIPYFSLNQWTLFGQNMQNGIYQGFKGIVNSIGGVLNGIISMLDSAFSRLSQSVNDLISKYNSVAEKVEMPTLSNVSYQKIGQIEIPQYAIGGFPEDGLFFANHTELVGQFSNGRTAVANNEMIVAGIEGGVQRAVENALSPYLREIAENTKETAQKDMSVNIGDREIARANIRGQRSMGLTLRTT